MLTTQISCIDFMKAMKQWEQIRRQRIPGDVSAALTQWHKASE